MAAPSLPSSWREPAWLLGAALIPALAATDQLDLSAAGRDAAVIRAAGLGAAGAGHGLDAWLAAPFALLPLGTRTFRAELAAVLLVAAAAMLVFAVVRRWLLAARTASALSSVVAMIAAATVTCSHPFQRESRVPGSALLGVDLVLLALVLPRRPRLPALVALLVLLSSYDPVAGLCALVVTGVSWRLGSGPSFPSSNGRSRELGFAAFAGLLALAPGVVAALRPRVSPLSSSAPLVDWAHGADGARQALLSVEGALGKLLLLLALVGLVLGSRTASARREGLPLAALGVAAGAVFVAGGGAAHDDWSLAGLLLLACLVSFAAVAMQEAVSRVAAAKVPMASASAAMVVVLELAFPVVLLDDGLTRADTLPRLSLPLWEDTAFAGVPSGALVLVEGRDLYARLLATEAAGELPGDLQLLPTFDPRNEGAAAALARDPRLVPLVRDFALTGTPEELTLSTLAASRPVVVAANPGWERTLSRHLVPRGLLSVFEPEPRGGADRKRALEATASSRARLAKALTDPDEAPLRQLTAALLFDRALAAAGAGEREVATAAAGDVTLFAPGDPRVTRLLRDEEAAHGPLDVKAFARGR